MRNFLLAILACAAWSTAAAEAVPSGIMVLDGRPAPALRLADMDGRVRDLAGLRGRWVMVHFWASWCGPCRKEMPTIQRMARQLVPEGLEILMVNTAEDEDTVFSFLTIVGPDMNTLLDRDGAVTARWQPRGLPSSFMVDPGGRLRYLVLGGREWDSSEYMGFLRGLIARARPAP